MRGPGDTSPPPDGPADPNRVADWTEATFTAPGFTLPEVPEDPTLDEWPDDPVADPEAAARSIAAQEAAGV